DDARVADDARVLDAHGREARGQVPEGGHGRQHQGDARRLVEGAVDGPQPVLPRLRTGQVDPEDRGDHADGGDDQRENQAVLNEGSTSQDQGGDDGDRVGLEQVGRHARAVTDVVTHVVGDGGGVAGVVLRNVLLDLAHQVGADVGG